MIRKLYDPQVAEAPAGISEGLNIAALMASKGVMNDTDNPVATPIEITKEETASEAELAATATPASTNAETPSTTTDTPLPTEELKAAEPQKAAEPVKVPTWQEVLKQHQPDTILKELGFDEKAIRLAKELNGFEKADFFANLVNSWKTNGDLKEYLRELSTDYTKMPAEDVMRHQLRSEYPKASDKALEILYKKEIVEKYNLDSVDEVEAEEGKLLLEAKAERYRDEFVVSQQSKLFPKPPEAKATEPDNSEQLAREAVEAYRSKIIDSSYTKDILATNKITLGDGEDKFQYPVKAGDLTEVLFDDEKWRETQFDIERNSDGSIKSYSPKVQHQLLTAAVAKYGMAFFNEYAKHLKSLGGKAVIDPIENAKPPEGSTAMPAEAAPKNAAEAMARQGQLNSGGYNR